MKGTPEVIASLGSCLLEKHSTLLRINRYETQCLLWGYINIGNFFAKIVREDINSLFKLTKRILFLGGSFDEVISEVSEFGDTVEEMLPEVKEYVLRNIATLTDALNLFHRRALAIALTLGGVMALAQPLSGDLLARRLHQLQPAKLAAMEGQFQTERCAPLRIGGIPSTRDRVTRYAIEIPCGLSLLAAHDPDAEILGLDSFPPDEIPPVEIVHVAFQVMVAIGFALMALALWGGWVAIRRRRLADGRIFLRLLILATPLPFIAIQAGWVVTEVGRQPWIIYGVMRVSDAVTPMPGLVVPFTVFTLLYIALSVIVVYLLRRQFVQSPRIIAPAGNRVEDT
jgi:cytochrome bd-type quinol oxidase subunit 1